MRRAISKHGVEAFEKEVLFVFDNPEEMFAKEAELVNEEFLARPDVYNIKLGGQGGWDHIDPNKIAKSGYDAYLGKLSKEERSSLSKKNCEMMKQKQIGIFSEESRELSRKKVVERNKSRTGIKMSDSGRRNQSLAKKGTMVGRKFLHNGAGKVIHVPGNEFEAYIKAGWFPGQKMRM